MCSIVIHEASGEGLAILRELKAPLGASGHTICNSWMVKKLSDRKTNLSLKFVKKLHLTNEIDYFMKLKIDKVILHFWCFHQYV